MSNRSFTSDFKQFFGRGLAILLPSILTLWILWQAVGFLFNNVAAPINAGVRTAVVWVVPKVLDEEQQPKWFAVSPDRVDRRLARRAAESLPNMSREQVLADLRREQFREQWDQYWFLHLTGLVIAVLLIYFAGLLLGNFFGRAIYHRVEGLIKQIPGFKQVYPHVKQVVDLIFGDRAMAFSKVVLVEYPSKDIWTVGFLTGRSFGEIREHIGESMTIFIPTSPTPFTGFTINVPAEGVIEMRISIEQALRFVITAGVLSPDGDDDKANGNAMVAAEIARAKADKAKDSDSPESLPQPGDAS